MNGLLFPTLAAALLLFPVGQRGVRSCRSAGARAAASAACFALGVPGALLALYYLHVLDHAKWFYEFRSLPFTELAAAGAGLSAGALAELAAGGKLLTRPLLVTLLSIGIAGPYLKPILTPVGPSRFADRWRDGVCLQSTESSCGAASAATVLRALGVCLREQDLARECFTSLGGTENWYLARAFRRRGFDVRYRIESGLPADLRTPAIAGVRIGDAGHFIAILESADKAYVTGDPLVGREEVPAERMTNTFYFTGFFMEIGARR